MYIDPHLHDVIEILKSEEKNMTAIKRRAGSSTLEIAEEMVRALNPVTQASYREILVSRINYAQKTDTNSLERQELAEFREVFDNQATF